MVQYPLTFTLRNTALTPTSLSPKRGMFARLIDAMMASRQRRVDREIARYLAATGASGRLTDSIEREIEHRFLSNRSRW
jgi:hypothetical protein